MQQQCGARCAYYYSRQLRVAEVVLEVRRREVEVARGLVAVQARVAVREEDGVEVEDPGRLLVGLFLINKKSKSTHRLG